MDAVETCAWQFRIEAVSLSCAVHDPDAVGAPGAAGRCALRRAKVCRLCVREVMPVHPGSSGSLCCGRCQRLDRALARQVGASTMTPLDGHGSSARWSLFGRLFPDRVPQEVEEVVTRADGSTMTVTVVVQPEPHPLALLTEHGGALGLAMAQAAVEVDGGPASLRDGGEGGGHLVRWDEWARCFPASDEASARAYQRYVAQVHPWIDTVEPRVADHEWLAGLLRGA